MQLLEWRKYIFLYDSWWITIPFSSFVFFYSFCVSLLYSHISLIVSLLSAHNLHFLLANILWIFPSVYFAVMVSFYADIRRGIVLMSRVFANGPGDRGSIPGRVIPKTQKMVFDAVLLYTQHYKVRIKVKVEQSMEWSSALPYTS